MRNLVFFALILYTAAFCPTVVQSGVCYVIASQSVEHVYYELHSYTYTFSCGWWDSNTCYAIAYESNSYYQTVTEYFAQFTCCSGYRQVGTSQTCGDIDECCEGTSGCSQTCSNTIGSYVCQCIDGFQLSSDSKTCIDIDECMAGTSGCSQMCINAIGSYVCLCNSGYRLSYDKNSCIDIDECAVGTSGCSQICINTIGSYYCQCYSGFQLSSDSKTCIDIDECAVGTSCCSQICINTIGSYVCLCNSGYKLSTDRKTCIDIDECAAGTSGCSQICSNTTGSYVCLCNSGYQLFSDGKTCMDIDECAVGTSGCSQICNNTIGSYVCWCGSGYQLSSDRKTCIDIDECAVGTSGCSQICNNTNGSYVCQCYSGYQLSSDSKTCIDIDECAVGTSGCSQMCSNTIGSYYCLCYSGYQLSSDNKTCIDIDECAVGTSGCSQICNNTVGSYGCLCKSGYQLSSDRKTCIALTPPAITWNGLSVANNSLVALSAIPNRVSTLGPQPLKFPLVCQGIKGGQWYQPNGILFPIATPDPVSTPGGLGQRNGTKGVELFRGVPSVFPHGVQCCTNTITTLCVGMYTDLTLAASSRLATDSGPSFDLSVAATYGPNITGGVQFQLLTPTNVDPPVFQLTCTSTSSPATRVQWTFNGSPVNGSNTTSSQIVIDRPTSTYNNILTVTGRSPGMYTCTVTTTCSPVCWGNGFTLNPRSANSSFIVGVPPEPPTDLTAVQSGPTAINISWTAPKSGGPVIRYDIYYIGNVDPVRIGNGSTTSTSWILTNVQFGARYNISIIAVGTYIGSRITSTSVLAVEAEKFGDCGPRLPLSPRSQSQTFTCTSSDSASINTVLLALRNCTERHN